MFFKPRQWITYALIVIMAVVSLWFSGSASALELQDENLVIFDNEGNRVSVVGNRAALRLGTKQQSGKVFLFPSSATSIFSEDQASITMNADGSSMSLKGDDSFIFIDGKDSNNRSRLTLRNGSIFLQAPNGASSIQVNDNGGICIGNC